MPNQYTMGKMIRLSATFTDTTGALADPTTVTAKVRNPQGVTVVAASPTRDSLGLYHYDYVIPSSRLSAGTWAYRFEGTGGGPTAADDAFFVVPPDPFYM